MLQRKFSLAPCTTKVYYKSDGQAACGFFLEKGLSWNTAVKSCSAKAARLPVVTTMQENQDIFQLIVGFNSSAAMITYALIEAKCHLSFVNSGVNFLVLS